MQIPIGRRRGVGGAVQDRRKCIYRFDRPVQVVIGDAQAGDAKVRPAFAPIT